MIRIEHLSKQYRLQRLTHAQCSTTLRETLTASVAAWFGRLSRRQLQNPPRPTPPGSSWAGRSGNVAQFTSGSTHAAPDRDADRFWALRDISFDVSPGEVVGIIGRNGAGKSTLLKILSRITEPTQGRIRLAGRVTSLLEVGTGFHPELTGRENIFLNGAILGMSRAEIRSRFEQIVAFAEVERFLDTPVKRYSSGMQVRLAFAVAAHLEPEILILDEVLAVGDFAFQQKCIRRMDSVRQGGRTVLFVSHNLAAVQSLCTKVVYLESGRVEAIGEPDAMVRRYLERIRGKVAPGIERCIEIGSLCLDQCRVTPNPVESGSDIRVHFQLRARQPVRLTELAALIYTPEGNRVAIIDLREYGLPLGLEDGQSWETQVQVERLPLVEGDYSIGLYANAGEFQGNLKELVTLTVKPRRQTASHVAYPACHRGFLELNVKTGYNRQAA